MDDLSQKLNDMLSSPDLMQQLSALLSGMGNSAQNAGAPPGGDSAAHAQSEQAAHAGAAGRGGAGPGNSGPAGSGFDAAALLRLKQLFDATAGQEDSAISLLRSLRPFLGPRRSPHLDNIIQMVRLGRIAMTPGFMDLFKKGGLF